MTDHTLLPCPFCGGEGAITPHVHRGMTDTKEIIGTVCYVEWLNEETMGPDDDREPGTYVTIKVPDDSRWGFGKVAIRYVEGEYTEAAIEALDFDRNGGTTLEDLKADLQEGEDV